MLQQGSPAAITCPPTAPTPFKSLRRTIIWTCGLVFGFIVLAVGFYFISVNWPYRYREIHPLLEDVFASQVKITRYHRTYFPNPGFVAMGIILRRKSAPDLPPLGTVETLFVQGRWSDLLMLRQRVQLVDITGLHIIVPAVGSRAMREDFPPGSGTDFGRPDTMIERLEVHKSLLDIMYDDGKRFSFPIRELQLRNLHKGQAMTYAVDMENAKPAGHIEAGGSFGPLDAKDVGATPVSGSFIFSSVKLHDLGDIRGTLSSSGQFKGPLAALQAEASSFTPDFAVEQGEPTPVAASVRCIVNGVNGDVGLEDIGAKSGDTFVHASGSVAGAPKVANIDFRVDRGRAQDILRIFVHSGVPVTGPVASHGHAYVGPTGGGAGFLQRLYVNGVFDAPAGHVSDPETERSLSAFSLRAHDIDSPKAGSDKGDTGSDALSSLKGPATIRNGIVSTKQLTFEVSGAEADLGGTFNLEEKSVHLVGDLKMKSDVSHVTTGFKSVLLKPFAVFFKKKHAGAVIPIAVTGTPGHYKVTQNLSHEK